jgi:hypothetical protein
MDTQAHPIRDKDNKKNKVPNRNAQFTTQLYSKKIWQKAIAPPPHEVELSTLEANQFFVTS